MSDAESLAGCGVATVYEAGGRRGLIDIQLLQIVPGTSVAGRARTVRCAQDDNLAVHRAVEQLRAGEVLVLTMPEPRPVALVGDLLALQMHVRGAAAVLVDAAVRDRAELQQLGLPLWSRWVSAAGAAKAAPGDLDVPVRVGSTEIETGDVVVLDADGAVVVEAARVAEVAAAARRRAAQEAELRIRLERGELTLDAMQLRQAVGGAAR